MNREKAWVSWSSGKDSAWALEVTRRQNESEVVALLTTVNQTHHRVAMHAVRENLLEQQADALGLPLVKVWLPWPCPNADYENAMAAAVKRAQKEGVSRMVFGDLFLEDVRQYREEKLAGTGIQPAFPLWGMNTTELASQMIEAGLRAYLTCVDPKKLAPSFAGRAFDAALLADLPAGADPCGENGEFHTFAVDGPMFRHSIAVEPGEVIERGGFVFADLLPPVRSASSAGSA
ncbi:MAG: ATP-binding protein [Terriglobia bacterium]